MKRQKPVVRRLDLKLDHQSFIQRFKLDVPQTIFVKMGLSSVAGPNLSILLAVEQL